MGGFRWKIDRRALASKAVRAAAADGLGDAAEFLREEADRTVPIDEGTLQGSGGVDVDRDALAASVFYDTPYAARQHEDLSLGHAPGRRAKWLEHTFKEQAPVVVEHLAKRIRAVT